MFRELVRDYRLRLSMTQEELAQRAGMSTRSIGNLEVGRIATPRPGTVRLLADALELTGDERDQFYRYGTDYAATRQPARSMPATTRPLADELFLIGHDRQHGKPLGRALLPYGLAGAALGELILAGHIDVLSERLIIAGRADALPRSGPDADPVVSYLSRELADPELRHTATLDQWIRGAATEVTRRVAQRLTQDHLVIGHRRRGRLRYRHTESGQLASPVGRVTSYLLDQLPPPDTQTLFLIALVDVLDMYGALVLDMTQREIQRRTKPTKDLLPPGIRAVTASVARVIWRRTVLPRL